MSAFCRRKTGNQTLAELIDTASHRGDEMDFVVISHVSSILDVVKRRAVDEYGNERFDLALLVEYFRSQGRKGSIGAGKNFGYGLAGDLKRLFPVHTFTHHGWNIDSGH